MSWKKFGKNLEKYIMTGISYMIPIIIAGAVLMAISRIGATFFSINDIWDPKWAKSGNLIIQFLHTDDGWGSLAFGLMFPVISAFIAYGMVDKVGIAPGIIGGLLVYNMNAGFLGALASGLVAGYTIMFLQKFIHLPKVAQSVMPIFIIPVVGSFITLFIIQYIIGTPFADLNTALSTWLKSLTGVNKILLATIVGAMVGFDLGGPVNKAAVTTSMALITSKVYVPNTAAQIAIIIPPLGLGMATLIQKNKFNRQLQEAGKPALITGIIGVSEGAIPFAVASPLKVIPINVIGCALGSAFGVGFGAVNRAPISGFYGWFAVQNWWIYIIAILIGTSVVTGLTLLTFKTKENKENFKETKDSNASSENEEQYFTEDEWES